MHWSRLRLFPCGRSDLACACHSKACLHLRQHCPADARIWKSSTVQPQLCLGQCLQGSKGGIKHQCNSLICLHLVAKFGNVTMQLPKRLARRLMDLQFLPYIVVTNPHIKKVYDSYQHAFETLHNLPRVKTVEQNAEFTVLLKRLVDEHGQSPCSTFICLLLHPRLCMHFCPKSLSFIKV